MVNETIHRADLLVELGCEELPPKTLTRLARAFMDGVCKGLADAGLEFDADRSELFYTPRRLAFRLADVPGRQADQVLDRRGPAVSAAFDDEGNPTQAALGFARSVGHDINELERQETDKGAWLFCRVEKPGQSLVEVLYPVLEKALAGLPVAKPMRWASHSFSFVRPVHWLLVLHGDEVLPGELFGKAAGRDTLGHRIHAPGLHPVASAADYEQVLKSASVMVDPEQRKNRIREMALQAGSEQGGFTRVTETLLDEVSNIIEWPVPVYCRFEESFLEVPEEALIASMEDHQKFFPVLDADGGTLTSGFVVIANLESTHVDAVREGFERVIRPRLADAQFFWEQDRKKPLADYSSALDDVVFQKKLGSIGDKSKRIAKISSKLAELTNKDQTHAARASGLCKADLLTQMVGEFPELQGTMGGHYARVSGEDKAVSNAIAEHYAPRFAGDAIPASAIGQLVSLADRMDSLVGIFAAGLKPTGNKDPFALRRAALGAVRILTEADIQVSLDELLNISAKALGSSIEVTQQNIAEVRTFMLERLRHDCLDHGFETNVVNAVFAAPVSTLPDLRSRLEALNAFMDQPVAERLIAANKRIGNILRKADFDISTKIDTNLLNIAEEKQLFDEVNRLKAELDPVFSRAEYAPALAALAGLDETIAAFFDHVMVMDEDSAVRDNRLALLNQLKSMFDRIADLAQAT